MASYNTALGFVRGARGALADVRQRKQEDEDRALKQSELAHAQQRRGITEQRQDIEWEQGQQDRAAQQSALKVAEQNRLEQARKQAEVEGVGRLADALEAGLDPAAIESHFNASGNWKIAPGTLKYDKASGQVSFTGAGGTPFSGTMAQLRTIFGAQKAPGKLTTAGKNERVLNERGEVVLPADPKFEQVDPTKDLYEIRNGERTLIRPGKKEGGAGDRKISPYNPESAAIQAAAHVESYYRGDFDEKTNTWKPFRDEDARTRSNFSQGLAGQLSRLSKGRMSPTEIGVLAVRAGETVPSIEEARKQARADLGPHATQQQEFDRAKTLQKDAMAKATKEAESEWKKMESALDGEVIDWADL